VRRLGRRSRAVCRVAGTRRAPARGERLARGARSRRARSDGAWTIWQPQRAADANDAALVALDAGRVPQALADAQHAADVDPLSLDPRFTLAAAQVRAGQPAAARATLEQTVRQQPANPESWLRLGQLELDQGDGRAALPVLNAAVYLDPQDPATQASYASAQQAAGGAR
jgi:predicted Zn-dependent protease